MEKFFKPIFFMGLIFNFTALFAMRRGITASSFGESIDARAERYSPASTSSGSPSSAIMPKLTVCYPGQAPAVHQPKIHLRASANVLSPKMPPLVVCLPSNPPRASS